MNGDYAVRTNDRRSTSVLTQMMVKTLEGDHSAVIVYAVLGYDD